MSAVREVGCTTCGGGGDLALHQSPAGRPRSRFYQVAHRVARRFEPAVAQAFLGSLAKLQRQVDASMLRQAVASGSVDQVTAAIASGGNMAQMLDATNLEKTLYRTATTTGRAGADVLTGVTGMRAQFNALHPDVVLYARQQAGELMVAVSKDTREAVRIVLAIGQVEGLTVVQQAQAIREVVGLPPNWSAAPSNLAKELREGRFTSTRRLSGVDKAQIRSRLARGTVDEEFIARMQGRYAASLTNRRALNISRTESLMASHHGQNEGWKQAMHDGVLPDTARRMWVVTLDDVLEHWMVPGMNAGGRGMDEMFDTPEGPALHPPSRPNCRCGTGLRFPGRPGVL